eukprot:5102630-Prymnesium_polylepis.1
MISIWRYLIAETRAELGRSGTRSWTRTPTMDTDTVIGVKTLEHRHGTKELSSPHPDLSG